MMSHERLDVYQCTIKFLAIALRLLDDIPRGFSPLADQLKRAAMGMPLQIAEGAGKRTSADCRRFFDYARGSAMECSAALDVMRECNFGEKEHIETGKALLDRIAAMLTKLAGRGSPPTPPPALSDCAHATDWASETVCAPARVTDIPLK
jgi:four helix bundle protein